MNLNREEADAEWGALDPGLKEALRATVRSEESWRDLPRQVRVVHPLDVDTTRLDRILSNAKLTAQACVLGIKCLSSKHHTLANVLRDGDELVYVADADRVARGYVHYDESRGALNTYDVAPVNIGRGRELRIEYLDRTARDYPPAMLADYLLPARCKCDGKDGAVLIPFNWIKSKIDSRVRWAIWPESG